MLVTTAFFCLTACDQQITTQMISGKDFREWFYWRLMIVTGCVAIFGIILSVILRSLPVNAAVNVTHTNRRVRIIFAVALLVLLLIIPFGLWIDAYLTQPFGKVISWSNYFSLVITNTYTISIVIVAAIVFYLVIMLFTRFIYRICHCRYAFLPNFKRSNK